MKLLEHLPSFKNPKRNKHGRFRSFYITSDEMQSAITEYLDDINISAH